MAKTIARVSKTYNKQNPPWICPRCGSNRINEKYRIYYCPICDEREEILPQLKYDIQEKIIRIEQHISRAYKRTKSGYIQNELEQAYKLLESIKEKDCKD